MARSQAESNFARTYTNLATNSSLTIAAADNLPGLRITGWINNGSDIYTGTYGQLDLRILPNHLYDGHDGKVGFTTKTASPMPSRLFYGPCYSWINVDEMMFAGVPMGQSVFDVDAGLKAITVQSLGLSVEMEREAD